MLSDSGSLIYRKNKNNKVKPVKFLGSDPTYPWSNIMAPDIVGGAAWADWVAFLETFVEEHGHLKELCPDKVKRFPAHISVIVLDNLNGTGIDHKWHEDKKKAEDRPTLQRF